MTRARRSAINSRLLRLELLERRIVLDGSMYVGMNLDYVVDWGAVPFVDVFSNSRSWMTRNEDGSGEWNSGLSDLIPASADGWPTQIPFDPGTGAPMQIVHSVMPLRGVGTYTFHAEGTGTVEFVADSGYLDPTTPFNRSVVLELTGGTAEYDLVIHDTDWGDGTGPLFFEIHSSDASDPIRNIDLVLAGFETSYQTNPFHPTYTDELAPMSNLRFMDWGKTNGNPLKTWDDRTAPHSYSQTLAEGVSLEYIVQFANHLQQDAWICIPHMADDDYVTQAAHYIHENLDPSLKVFVEYSNETWNTAGAFSQTDYVQDQGELLGLDADRWRAGQMYVALRTAKIWQIFADEFGSADAQRLVNVMATKGGGSGVTSTRMLALQNPVINQTGIQPDALAIAPYFGGPVANEIVANGEVNTISVDTILDRAQADMQTDVTASVATDKAIADAYGLWLITYEGGQHLVGSGGNENNQELTDKLIAANRHQRMYDLYIEYLDMLRDGGIVLHCNYSYVRGPSKWGSWGVMEDQDQPVAEAHKYRALVDWIAANPAQNLAPRAQAGADAQFVDDGDQVEAVTVDGSGSRDLDGQVDAYEWRREGSLIGTDALLQIDLTVGIHQFELTAIDDDGASATDTVTITVAPQASEGVLVETNFDGAAPGLNTPWMQTSTLASNVTYSGWMLGPGLVGSAYDDVFAFSAEYGPVETTLQDAIDVGHYIAFAVEPAAAGCLDLRGATCEFTINRIAYWGPRHYAIMTSVGGFQAGNELFDTGRIPNYDPHIFSFTLPVEDFLHDGPVEFRIYVYQARYGDVPTSLSTFCLMGGWVPPGPNADFNSDGTVDGVDGTLWEAGFGTTSGAEQSDGDADHDGDVDGSDFLNWQQSFVGGTFAAGSAGSGLSAAVPTAAVVDSLFSTTDMVADTSGSGLTHTGHQNLPAPLKDRHVQPFELLNSVPSSLLQSPRGTTVGKTTWRNLLRLPWHEEGCVHYRVQAVDDFMVLWGQRPLRIQLGRLDHVAGRPDSGPVSARHTVDSPSEASPRLEANLRSATDRPANDSFHQTAISRRARDGRRTA